MNILVTGGTVFVSRYVADYFRKNHNVFVLNRNTKKQLDGVYLIKADRQNLGDCLKKYHFDAVLDICAYTGKDVNALLNALPEGVKDYILISSSAVYPETNSQPFTEEQNTGSNSIWGAYGTNKIEAEKALFARLQSAYVLRPPYLYGPMQNVYREPFVFECALLNRPFYIPKDGRMKMQFFHVEDLCRVIEKVLEIHPDYHVINVGNENLVDINEFVSLCYAAAGSELKTVNVFHHQNQRDYFCFHEYEYCLDITKQQKLIANTKDLETGLRESFQWFVAHQEEILKKTYIDYIDSHADWNSKHGTENDLSTK